MIHKEVKDKQLSLFVTLSQKIMGETEIPDMRKYLNIFKCFKHFF